MAEMPIPDASRAVEGVYFVLNGLVKILRGCRASTKRTDRSRAIYIGHFGGIAVSPNVRLGSDCTMGQNITIGAWGLG
jgi:serine acetyltransferase